MDVRDVQQLESAGDVQALTEALAETDPRLRRQACFALGQLGTGDATDGLVLALLEDDDPPVRAAAAEALGWIRDLGAARPLIRSLEKDADGEVRAHAARALGALGDRTALPALEAAARASGTGSASAGDPGLEAVLALGRLLPDPTAEATLRELSAREGETGRLARQALLPQIVWESYYQDTLRHLAADAGWGEAGWAVEAELRAEPENPYDQDAVVVVAVAMGKPVGYLRNDYALAFAAALRKGAIPCTIEIRGSRRLTVHMVSLEVAPEPPVGSVPARPPLDQALHAEALALLERCTSEEMTAFCLRRLGAVSDARDAVRVSPYLEDPRQGVRAAAKDVLRSWGAGVTG